MRKSVLALLLLGLSLLCSAAPPDGPRHLVRAGWGDMMFEALAYHPGAGKTHFGYTGHLFADYRYRATKVVSAGGQLDFQGIFWTESGSRSRNYDLCIIPNVRFTYFENEYVQLYSGLGLGVLLAFDNVGKVEAAPAIDATYFGVQAGKGHWGGFLDLGGLTSLTGLNNIYMVSSRILSAGVYFCW